MNNFRRNSKKRQAIYDFFCQSKAHPSAEQVYNTLKPEYTDLSLGTVYRNIGVLLDDGLIISVGNVNGEERFDACTCQHAHFICSSCGAVIDIPIDGISSPDYKTIENSISAKIESHILNFTGLCKKCRQK